MPNAYVFEEEMPSIKIKVPQESLPMVQVASIDASENTLDRDQAYLLAPEEQPGAPIEPSEMTDHGEEKLVLPAQKASDIHDLLDIDVEEQDQINDLDTSPKP